MSTPILTSVCPQPETRAGVVGFVSLALGLAALGTLGGAVLIWQTAASLIMPWAGFLAFASFLFATSASITGLIGRLRPIKAKASFTGLMSGAAALVLLVPSCIYGVWTLATGQKQSEPFEVAPTIISDEAMYAADFRTAWEKWTRQYAVEPVLRSASGRADETVTSDILNGFVREWLNDRGQLQRSDWNLLAARLAEVDSKDPIPLLIVASRSDHPGGAITSREPIKALRLENVSPFWNLLFELQRARTLSRSNQSGEKESSLKFALAALDQLIMDGAFGEDEDWLLADLIVFRLDELLFEADFGRVISVVESHHRSEWLVELLKGKHESELAWKSRGGGYSYTVTKEGRRGFLEHLGRARTHFERSWSLAPNFPFAAIEMIKVSMGSSTDARTEMKTWLDRACASHADSWPAHSAFLWGMRPRWHGSHREILAYGESWLATGRYDTKVPSFFVEAVKTVADETGPDFYGKSGVYEKLVAAHEAYITAIATPEEERYRRSCLAITAFHAGRFEDLKNQWNILDGDPDREAFTSHKYDQEDLLFRAAIGDGTPTIRRALAAAERGDYAAASNGIEATLKKSGWSVPETEALTRRHLIYSLQERFAQGETIDLFAEDRSLWRAVEGRFSFGPDGTITATSDSLRYAVEHPLRLGEDFEIELELETRREMFNRCGPGILVSDDHFDTKNWLGYYVRREDTRWANVVALHVYAPYLSIDTTPRDRMTLRLICHDTSWEAFADGKRIHSGELKVLRDHIGEGTRLCLNGWTTTPIASHSQRFLGLRVRRMEALPETSLKVASGIN